MLEENNQNTEHDFKFLDSQLLGVLTMYEYAEEFKKQAGYYPQHMPSQGIYPGRKFVLCPLRPRKQRVTRASVENILQKELMRIIESTEESEDSNAYDRSTW